MNDEASLQNLNDIVVAAPVPWWPPAPGWYLAALLVLAVLAAASVRYLRRRRRDRYRRQALRELAAIRAVGAERLAELPALLKRAALSAWPREQVAALSGAGWHRFLDDTAGTGRFSRGAGARLDELAYAGRDSEVLPETDAADLCEAAEYWLRRHRAPTGTSA